MNMPNLFKLTSFLEGTSYLLLLFVAVPMKYYGGDESMVKMLGMPHGIFFIAYIGIAFWIKDQMKWDNKTFLIVLVASLIPFGTFYVNRKYV